MGLVDEIINQHALEEENGNGWQDGLAARDEANHDN